METKEKMRILELAVHMSNKNFRGEPSFNEVRDLYNGLISLLR